MKVHGNLYQEVDLASMSAQSIGSMRTVEEIPSVMD